MDKTTANSIRKLLSPAEKQKQRMLLHILSADASKKSMPQKQASRKRRKPVFAAALAACLITTTAFAAVYWGLDMRFLEFLKPVSREQQQFLESGAYSVNQQAVQPNGTLTVKQAIGDSNLTYLFMEFTGPEGTVFNQARYRFGSSSDSADYSGFYSTDFILLDDENGNDNQISLIMRIETSETLTNKTLRLHLTDLEGAGPYPDAFHTVVTGNWDLFLSLDFQNCSTDYQTAQPISMCGFPATIRTVSISPISIALKIDTPYAKQISSVKGGLQETGPNKYLDNYPVTIRYRDGTSETTTLFQGMSHADFLTGEMLFIKTFENVINHKEIASITFFDTELPIAP